MSNFWARTITGLSMVLFLLFTLAFSFWLLAAFFFVVALLGLWEFYTIFTSDTLRPQRLYGSICGGVSYLAIVLFTRTDQPVILLPAGLSPILLMLPLLFLPFVLELFRKQPQPLSNIAVTIAGIVYIVLPLALLNLMNGPDVLRVSAFPVLLTGFFLLTWLYDTAAYLYGKRFGKHTFVKRISPKKTWEGTLAGAVVSLLSAVGLHLFAPAIQLMDWLVMALLIIVFGTAGDLIESLFKRSLDIKDSGAILPGHGGILDRFDSILISIPFVFLYLVLRNLI